MEKQATLRRGHTSDNPMYALATAVEQRRGVTAAQRRGPTTRLRSRVNSSTVAVLYGFCQDKQRGEVSTRSNSETRSATWANNDTNKEMQHRVRLDRRSFRLGLVHTRGAEGESPSLTPKSVPDTRKRRKRERGKGGAQRKNTQECKKHGHYERTPRQEGPSNFLLSKRAVVAFYYRDAL